jgi:DNA-binding GntR family transcriptional regulator
MSRSTLSQSISQALAADIIARRLMPGVRLDEISLAKRFKVSRSPVRDALRQLVPTGLIEYFPRRGFSVAKIDNETLKDIFEGLGEIEALCAGLCALRANATDRATLEAIHTKAIQAVEGNDSAGYATINEEFHDAIYSGAHNNTLKTVALNVRQRLAPFRSDLFFQHERVRSSLDEHQEIVAAILSHDAENAAALMRLHVTRTAINVLEYLSEGPRKSAPRLERPRRVLEHAGAVSGRRPRSA